MEYIVYKLTKAGLSYNTIEQIKHRIQYNRRPACFQTLLYNTTSLDGSAFQSVWNRVGYVMNQGGFKNAILRVETEGSVEINIRSVNGEIPNYLYAGWALDAVKPPPKPVFNNGIFIGTAVGFGYGQNLERGKSMYVPTMHELKFVPPNEPGLIDVQVKAFGHPSLIHFMQIEFY